MPDLARIADLALELAEDLSIDDELPDGAELVDAVVMVELQRPGDHKSYVRYRATTHRATVVLGLIEWAREIAGIGPDDDDDQA